MKQSVFILLFVSIFGFFNVTDAQIITLPETEVSVELSPENPSPNGVVYASVISYGTNLDAATITWKINGKTQKSGMGEKSLSFTVGETNTTTTIEVSIKTREGESIQKTLRIKPTSVDLLWESESFVPPFYKGKSLFSHQNKITMIALPHITTSTGVEIGTKNLIYTWKKNGSVVEGASGFGKNTYTFTSSLISRPFNIEVEVTTISNSGSGYASTNISPTDPDILFYKKDPLLGIEFQKTLQNTVSLKDSKELIVVSVPLFFGTTNSTSGGLSYKWLINGSPINNNPKEPTQIFRLEEGSSGVSKISLSIENDQKILQYASNSFNLSFNNK
jgi:hypothetical protein